MHIKIRIPKTQAKSPDVPFIPKEEVSKIAKTENKTVFSKSYLSFSISMCFFFCAINKDNISSLIYFLPASYRRYVSLTIFSYRKNV